MCQAMPYCLKIGRNFQWCLWNFLNRFIDYICNRGLKNSEIAATLSSHAIAHRRFFFFFFFRLFTMKDVQVDVRYAHDRNSLTKVGLGSVPANTNGEDKQFYRILGPQWIDAVCIMYMYNCIYHIIRENNFARLYRDWLIKRTVINGILMFRCNRFHWKSAINNIIISNRSFASAHEVFREGLWVQSPQIKTCFNVQWRIKRPKARARNGHFWAVMIFP